MHKLMQGKCAEDLGCLQGEARRFDSHKQKPLCHNSWNTENT